MRFKAILGVYGDRKSSLWWEKKERKLERKPKIESWNKAKNWYKSNSNAISGVNCDRKSASWWKHLIESWIES